ncbi:MAG: energy transducer TonB [Nitrospirota bacterium]
MQLWRRYGVIYDSENLPYPLSVASRVSDFAKEGDRKIPTEKPEEPIKEGSGITLLDRNAIETVKKASPFPRPPVEAQLLIPIKYSLN